MARRGAFGGGARSDAAAETFGNVGLGHAADRHPVPEGGQSPLLGAGVQRRGRHALVAPPTCS